MGTGDVQDTLRLKELETVRFAMHNKENITQQATVANPAVTSAAVGDQGATQNTGWGADTEAHFDEIRTLLNQHTIDVTAMKTAIDLIIVRLKAFGFIA